MRVETERLYLYPISNAEMHSLIEKEADAEMKQAYTEMLEGCLMEPDNRIWYAVWNMELKMLRERLSAISASRVLEKMA